MGVNHIVRSIILWNSRRNREPMQYRFFAFKGFSCQLYSMETKPLWSSQNVYSRYCIVHLANIRILRNILQGPKQSGLHWTILRAIFPHVSLLPCGDWIHSLWIVAETLGGLVEDTIFTIHTFAQGIGQKGAFPDPFICIRHLFHHNAIALWRGSPSLPMY